MRAHAFAVLFAVAALAGCGGSPEELAEESSDARACDGRPVNVLTSPNHCGRCGQACGPREECRDGTCQSGRPDRVGDLRTRRDALREPVLSRRNGVRHERGGRAGVRAGPPEREGLRGGGALVRGRRRRGVLPGGPELRDGRDGDGLLLGAGGLHDGHSGLRA
jgi:hypothetical protein